MEKSPEIKNIAQALLTFHKEMGAVYKEDENPFFRSKYASLPTILKAIKEPLQKAQLAFTQFPVDENSLTTILMHPESGEYLSGTFKMTPTKNDPQGQGSLLSYARRYALGAVLGLTVDEDDDGNKSSQVTDPIVKKVQAQVPLTPDEYEMGMQISPDEMSEARKEVNRNRPVEYRNGVGRQSKATVGQGMKDRGEI